MQQVCHRCKQKFSSTELIHVSLSAEGEYAPTSVLVLKVNMLLGQRSVLPGIVVVGRNYLVWYGSAAPATM